MFPLHDRTRRLLCRTVFVTLGLLPAIAVLAWSGSVNSGGHRARVCAELQATIGLGVRLEDVSYPRPHVMVLHGLELIDRESQASVVRCRVVEIQKDGLSKTIVASQPEIDLAHFSRLKRVIEDHLRTTASSDSLIRFIAAELALTWSSESRTVRNGAVEFKTESGASRVEGVCTFENAPVRWKVTREKRAEEFCTEVIIDSGESALPCSLLADLLGCENRLGSHSTFCGTMSLIKMPDGAHAQCQGEFADIDLNAAISRQFPHRLGGIASIHVDRAVICRGRMEEVQATIQAGPGVVSYSLLEAASESLGMKTIPKGAENIIDYEKFAGSLTLDDRGLVIKGECDSSPPGTLLRAKTGPLLIAEGRDAVPIVALVKTLVPDSRIQVPATRQTDWLLQILPVPDVLPNDPHAAPHARLRDGRALQ